ncbi:MAG: hypothetical protein DMG65_14240 [Candidatus Angelobacter sp. Gp1-AA117]|nr:MAG: hypothetical protein DMG65_14240 [Candidatus Angelobacter sp. Gp1-AA117]
MTSAKVTLNGNQILDASAFNRKTPSLQVAIPVLDYNELAIEVEGKPQTFLSVTVVESLPNDFAAVIDRDGGVLQITDQESPLFGTALAIPAGALNQPTLIRMDRVTSFPPSGYLAAGGAVRIQPAGLTLNNSVELTLPFSDLNNDGLIDGLNLPAQGLAITSEDGINWAELPSSSINGSLITSISHFSVFAVAVHGTGDTLIYEMNRSDPADKSFTDLQETDSHDGTRYFDQAIFPPRPAGDNIGLRLTTTAGTTAREKVATPSFARFSEGIFKWYAFVPDSLAVGTAKDAVSLGAFLFNRSDSSCTMDDTHKPCELDFEVYPGKSNVRAALGTKPDEVLVFMVAQRHFVRLQSVAAGVQMANGPAFNDTLKCIEGSGGECFGVAKIRPNSWHEFEINVETLDASASRITWKIDSVVKLSMQIAVSGVPYSVFASLEALADAGDQYPPKHGSETFFDYISHTILPKSLGTWSRVADMLTPRLAGTAGIAVVDGKIVVVGDHDGNPGLGTVNEEYDPVANQWHSKAPYPRVEGRLGLTRNAVVNGNVYFFGGANIFDNFATTTVDRYNPATDSWTLDVATYPLTVQHLGTITLSNLIYCFGGNSYNGSGYDQAFTFDATSPQPTFTPIQTMPHARFRPRVFVRDGKIWLAGGFTSGLVVPQIDIYDPIASQWLSGPVLPRDDELMWAGLLSDGHIYLVYGNPFPVVYRFRDSMQSWEKLAEAPLSQGDFGYGVSAIGNAIYIFGGGDPKISLTQKFVP